VSLVKAQNQTDAAAAHRASALLLYLRDVLSLTPKKNASSTSFADLSQPVLMHFKYFVVLTVRTRLYN